MRFFRVNIFLGKTQSGGLGRPTLIKQKFETNFLFIKVFDLFKKQGTLFLTFFNFLINLRILRPYFKSSYQLYIKCFK
jgi:hypothetical protein